MAPFFTETTTRDGGYGITNFITLYMIGVYIVKYRKEKASTFLSALIYLGCVLLTTIMGPIISKVYDYNNLINLIKSIAFFEIFRGIKIKPNKVINYLSAYTFSTYIIHQNSMLMPILYNELFKANEYLNSPNILINMAYTCIGIYIICITIEFIRRIIFRPLDNKINKIKFEIKCK